MDMRHPDLARLEDSLLVVIDVQKKLWKIIDGHTELQPVLIRLLKAAGILGVPVLLSEQYPEGLGTTVIAVKNAAGEADIIAKTSFSCWGEPAFRDAVHSLDRTTLVLCGIETQVCVLQTALDALAAGFQVHVVADAVGSRAPDNVELALARLRAAGAIVTCLESVLFEWMERSDRDDFKKISALLK